LSDKITSPFPSKIMLAVEDVEYIKKGVALAISLSKMWNSKLYLIHVVEEKKVPKEFEEWEETSGDLRTNYFNSVGERDPFVKEVETEVKNAGVNDVEVIYAHGNPADEILLAIKENNIDCVIMGGHEHSNFRTSFAGSVPEKVCTHASSTTCIIVR